MAAGGSAVVAASTLASRRQPASAIVLHRSLKRHAATHDPPSNRHRPGRHQDRDRRPRPRRHRGVAPPHPHPPGYPDTLDAIAALVRESEAQLGVTATVGIGIPGVISPATGLVKDANSIALNGHRFDHDISQALGREVRVENDANCFALSEATDGAGAGFGVVFGVILGTGCGGGIIMHGKVHRGPHRIAGEWGHTPLPWPTGVRDPRQPVLVRQAWLPGNLCRRPLPRARLRRTRRA